MSSWTCVTIEPVPDYPLSDCKADVEPWIRDVDHSDEPTLRTEFGNVIWRPNASHHRVSDTMSAVPETVRRVVVFVCNDTGDTGIGKLFARGQPDDPLVKVDELEGNSPELGRDIVQYFKSEYDVEAAVE